MNQMNRIIHQTVLFVSIALSIVHTIVSYSIGDVDPRVSCLYGVINMLFYCDVMLYSHTSTSHATIPIAGFKWCLASNFTRQ